MYVHVLYGGSTQPAELPETWCSLVRIPFKPVLVLFLITCKTKPKARPVCCWQNQNSETTLDSPTHSEREETDVYVHVFK